MLVPNNMNDKLYNRLNQLREEYKKGEAMMSNLDLQREELKESMLRIAGAIEVLEEFANSTPSNTETQQQPQPRLVDASDTENLNTGGSN